MSVYRLTVIIALVLSSGCNQTESLQDPCRVYECIEGAIVRGDRSDKTIALVFTGDEYGEGLDEIIQILAEKNVKGSFFFTGNFYRNPSFENGIRELVKQGHYLGAHSDRHLLYCDWSKRDSTLVTREEFRADVENNYREMARFGINKKDAAYFLPAYEWYNQDISAWTLEMGLQLVNMTQGTLSHADYTVPGMPNYRDSKAIVQSIFDFEASQEDGLNGFILLSHVGSGNERTDKLYNELAMLIVELERIGYRISRVDDLIK